MWHPIQSDLDRWVAGGIDEARLDEIAEFFRTYKNLEKKVTEILGWKDVDRVMPLVEKCVKAAS